MVRHHKIKHLQCKTMRRKTKVQSFRSEVYRFVHFLCQFWVRERDTNQIIKTVNEIKKHYKNLFGC